MSKPDLFSLVCGVRNKNSAEAIRLLQSATSIDDFDRKDLGLVIYPYVTSSVLNDWDGVEKHHQWNAMMQEAESFHTQKILVQSLDGVTKDKSSNKSSKM